MSILPRRGPSRTDEPDRCLPTDRFWLTDPFTLRQLQAENRAWVAHNFPDKKPYHPLLGALEELGELSHSFLKAEQGIRVGEDHKAKMVDAVADVIIFLADFCNQNGIDMHTAVESTWREVSKRDWIKYPTNGLTA